MNTRKLNTYIGAVIVLLFCAACEASGPRAMTTDGGRDAAADARLDAATDAPPEDASDGRCMSHFDCPPGVMCIDGRCQSEGEGCTSVFDCPVGQVCVEGRCTEREDPMDPPPGGSTCCDGVPCEGDLYCTEDCTCADPTVCDPPCADPLICDFGICMHPCFYDGCEGDLLCMEDGCREPRCTYEECTTMSPALACDPYDLGCYDPCADPFIAGMCEEMGAICEFGSCIDPTCSALGTGCSFVEDCCGMFLCQSDTDPAPECPETCPDPEDMPPADFCACDIGGFCTDHRWFAGYEGSGALPPLPGGGGSGDAGVPLPPP